MNDCKKLLNIYNETKCKPLLRKISDMLMDEFISFYQNTENIWNEFNFHLEEVMQFKIDANYPDLYYFIISVLIEININLGKYLISTYYLTIITYKDDLDWTEIINRIKTDVEETLNVLYDWSFLTVNEDLVICYTIYDNIRVFNWLYNKYPIDKTRISNLAFYNNNVKLVKYMYKKYKVWPSSLLKDEIKINEFVTSTDNIKNRILILKYYVSETNIKICKKDLRLSFQRYYDEI